MPDEQSPRAPRAPDDAADGASTGCTGRGQRRRNYLRASPPASFQLPPGSSKRTRQPVVRPVHEHDTHSSPKRKPSVTFEEADAGVNSEEEGSDQGEAEAGRVRMPRVSAAVSHVVLNVWGCFEARQKLVPELVPMGRH